MTMTSMRSLLLVGPLLFGVGLAMSACPSQVGVGCKDGEANCAPPPDDGPPRFFAEPPFGVGFECVTIGCVTDKSLTVENRGGGELALSLIRTTIDTSPDFRLRRADDGELPTPEGQVRLKGGETLELIVTYTPSDGILDEGAVEFDSYDGAIAYEDSAPVTNEVPLTARLFGTPVATLPSEVLDFGYVPVGSTSTLELVLENEGSESVLRAGPVSLEDPNVTAYRAPQAQDWSEHFANPGQSTSIPVTFTPATPDAFFATLLVQTNDPARPEVRVVLQGTAITEPRLAIVEPAGDLVLPAMRTGETRTGNVIVRNIGGLPLDVNAALTSGAELGLSVGPAALTQIPALGAGAFQVTLSSSTGGPVAGTLGLTSNDPSAPAGALVNVRGDVNAPRVAVSPSSLDFGDIVQGWIAEPRTIFISNDGYGELTITTLGLELGASSQISVVDLPPLPVKLAPGEPPVEVTVLFTASTIGAADAVLLIGSDSITGAEARVNLHGDVVTCEQGCPTANGTPDCSSGRCEVGSCISGFHDTNLGPNDGCECSEDINPFNERQDVSQACPGRDVGTLHDVGDPEEMILFGTLHSTSDIDLIFFDADDEDELDLDDDFGVIVEIISAPAGLQICANIQGNESGCGGLPTNCSSTRISNTNNRIGGDSKDVTVFMKWAPNVAPVCGEYRIRLRANAG